MIAYSSQWQLVAVSCKTFNFSFTGISMHKGYAFVQFTNPFDARNACHGEDGKTVLNQVLGEFLWKSDVLHNWPNSVAANFLCVWTLTFVAENSDIQIACRDQRTRHELFHARHIYLWWEKKREVNEKWKVQLNVRTRKFEKSFRTFHMIFPLVDTIKWTTKHVSNCQANFSFFLSFCG